MPKLLIKIAQVICITLMLILMLPIAAISTLFDESY